MAVARGVQGGGRLPPPQPPGHWKKLDKDYGNWKGIKFFIEQFVNEILTCDSFFFNLHLKVFV